MGEYATFGGEKIKIGTCESMFYLRLQDRGRVDIDENSSFGIYYRLPYPDEDSIPPGGYDNYNRGARLTDGFTPEMNESNAGTIQLKHECGILINVPCYHGQKLPEVRPDMRIFWNGKSWCFELAFTKIQGDKVLPIVKCRHCGKMWRFEWSEVLPYIVDRELADRLESLYA